MSKTIYILEDNFEILEVISLILSAEGMEVCGYSMVSEFQKALEKSMPDLFIIDVTLPDGHGLNICDHLKLDQKTKNIPVILITANSEIEKMKLRSRADDFIAKPFDIEDLVKRVKRLF
ncbi:hypothetical protein GCM10022246_24510 [Pedobacter ginsengiterrae]|uniref:Response regulatory domain-containing protein n=1 Tax=Pedobacter ginsengiterrae TaxID=871696 RepID=A0ABP7PTI3_9SPHI|nr:response regulator [Pedobacter aquatilis]